MNDNSPDDLSKFFKHQINFNKDSSQEDSPLASIAGLLKGVISAPTPEAAEANFKKLLAIFSSYTIFNFEENGIPFNIAMNCVANWIHSFGIDMPYELNKLSEEDADELGADDKEDDVKNKDDEDLFGFLENE